MSKIDSQYAGVALITGGIFEIALVNVENGQRYGQAFMNALQEVRPDIYQKITGDPTADPFYDNKLIPNFWEKVYELIDDSSQAQPEA